MKEDASRDAHRLYERLQVMAANYEYDLLILNGIVVTDTKTAELEIAVKGEKIARLVPRNGFSGVSARRIIDAEGGYVMACEDVLILGMR